MLAVFALALTPSEPALFLKQAAAYSAQHRGVSFYASVDGKLVIEEYPNQGSAERAWELASGTKSFTGVTAMRAVQDGILRLDEKVSDTLTEWKSDPKRSKATIRDLLTLTSGVPGGPSALTTGRVPSYKDAIAFEANAESGARFQYGPVPFQCFGELMKRKLTAKGTTVEAYMTKTIFKPLDIKIARWRKDRDGQPHLPSGISLTVRDWAKFGEMVRLGGKGVLETRLLDQCFIGTKANPGYGLTWWLPGQGSLGFARIARREVGDWAPKDLVMAGGAGGQRLLVSRSRNLVVVRQAPLRPDQRDTFDDIAWMRILFTGKLPSPAPFGAGAMTFTNR